MKHLKHLFTALLLLCATVATAHDFVVGGIYYDITSTTDFTVEVTYRGSTYNAYSNEYSGNEVIPESVTYNGSTYSVTSIGSYAFWDCSGLTSVEIPNSVTSIGSYAFEDCSGLTSVVIPNSVTSIGGCAFYGCSGLTSVTIGNGITSIGSYAFYGCSGLTSVVIPNSVISIGDYAFYDCSALTSVTIGNSVTSIGSYAFRDCSGLTSVVIGNSVTSIGSYAFSGCRGLTSVVIPNRVTSIGGRAFSYCSGLTSVTIGNGITSIASSAFDGCGGLKEVHINDLSAWCGIEFGYFDANPLYYAHNLYLNGELVTDLVIPDGVTEIKDYAFYDCRGLTCVVIPNSVTSIGRDAFLGCSGLKKVINFSSLKFSKGSGDYGFVAYYADTVINVLNGSVEGDFVFAVIDGVNTLCLYVGAGGDVTLPADYKGENYAIGSYAFNNNTSLTGVVIPNSVTSIGDGAFSGCSTLKEVHISDLSAWCNIAFASADANPLYYAENLYLNDELLTELTIPDSITEVKNFAFYNCSGLTSVVVPNSVTSIGEEAFRGCSDLEYIYISSTIKSIGDYAFAECNNIFDIKIGSKKAVAASENVFSSDAYNNACLYVPAGRKDFYAKTSPWSNFIIQEMDFTGIDEVKGENGKVEGFYYDLNGRAVERPANGLYIKNGKKVFVK